MARADKRPRSTPERPKRRYPTMNRGEKAAITEAAREVAAELNEKLEKEKKALRTRPDEAARKAANKRAVKRNRMRKRGSLEKPRCKGMNLLGKPCGQAPLIPENWDGPEEISGDYCLWHEGSIDDEQRESFRLLGTTKRPAPRRVTPGEIAHQLIQRSPHHFLRPYFKALGLELTEDGDIVRIGSGLKLTGFSRSGDVKRSRYPDYVGQVNVTEKLLDRIYGKARQAVDLASSNTTVNVHVVMDDERVSKVADVLANAGALMAAPNGNGNGQVIEGTAEDILDEDLA